MTEDIKTCIYCQNADESYNTILRKGLTRHPSIRIVTQAHDRDSLADCLDRLPINLLVMDLDPKPDATLVLMEEVCSHFPTINIIALADNADTNLVLAAMRAGCRQFIPKPIDQQDLSKALKLLTRSAGGKTKSDRVICVIGSSGGCGVTTVAANLAVELASLAAEPCALVDLQLEFGSLAT